MNPIVNLTAHELAGVTGAVAAAATTGLLSLLSSESCADADLAERANVDPIALSRVLGVLVAAGIVQRSPLGHAMLAPPLAEECAATPGGSVGLARLFEATPRFLQHGERSAHMDGDGQTRQRAYAPTVGALARLFAPAAEKLARALPAAEHVLDVGAGSGVWSLSMARANPETRVTALDLPNVLEVFVSSAAEQGLGQRASVLSGDYHVLQVPTGRFDRIVLANVLHLEPAAAAAELVRRMVAALGPGGQVVVVDVFDSAPDSGLGHAVYQLHLAMRTQSGFAHSRRDIEGWLQDAGTGRAVFIPLPGYVRGLGALCATQWPER